MEYLETSDCTDGWVPIENKTCISSWSIAEDESNDEHIFHKINNSLSCENTNSLFSPFKNKLKKGISDNEEKVSAPSSRNDGWWWILAIQLSPV